MSSGRSEKVSRFFSPFVGGKEELAVVKASDILGRQSDHMVDADEEDGWPVHFLDLAAQQVDRRAADRAGALAHLCVSAH